MMFRPLLALRWFLVLGTVTVFLSVQAQASFQQDIDITEFQNVAAGREEQAGLESMWVWNNVKNRIVGGGRSGTPATVSLEIPSDGTYFVWVWHAVHPTRSRTFFVEIGGNSLPYAWLPCGEASGEGSEHYPPTDADRNFMVWTKQEATLSKGVHTLTLTTQGDEPVKAVRHPAVVGRVLITNDPTYTPPPESP